jgi:hypothetical protein
MSEEMNEQTYRLLGGWPHDEADPTSHQELSPSLLLFLLLIPPPIATGVGE